MMSEHNRLASGNVTMGNIVKSLREIDDTEWSVWFEEVSHIDKVLREETDYETLDFGSRNTYRNTIELLARRSPKTEVEVARAAVEMARTRYARRGGRDASRQCRLRAGGSASFRA